MSERQPDKTEKLAKAKRIPLSEAEISALSAERARTGVDVAALYRALPEPRNGLKPHTIWQWLDGKTKSARLDHYRIVLETWRAIPDAPVLDGEVLGLGKLEMSGDKVVLSDKARAQFRKWQEASGVGAVALLKSALRDGETLPKGLKPAMILQWMSGATKVAKPEHLEFVVREWAKAAERNLEWVEISSETLARFREMREDGLLPGKIFKDAKYAPDGLSPPMISRWLSGRTTRARKDHLKWVLGRSG